MAKYVIDGETLQGLANALRKVTGEKRTYTPTEMIDAVTNIMETGTYILVDENGVEVPAVFVDNETRFTATANDIRIGTTAVTDSGVTEGMKEIPAYRTYEGVVAVPNGFPYNIVLTKHDAYDFTKLQAIICPFNTSLTDSVSAEKVSINGKLYVVGSSVELSKVSVDHSTKSIVLGISNDTGYPYVIRFFTYKEEK